MIHQTTRNRQTNERTNERVLLLETNKRDTPFNKNRGITHRTRSNEAKEKITQLIFFVDGEKVILTDLIIGSFFSSFFYLRMKQRRASTHDLKFSRMSSYRSE